MANVLSSFILVIGILYETKTHLQCLFLKKIICLQSDLTMELLNQNANEQQIMKNKRNVCIPRTSSLINAAPHKI
jgi:hypothetical protein